MEPNLAEVTREQMIEAEMAKITKTEQDAIRAAAEKIVADRIAEQEEAKRAAEQAVIDAKAREDAAAAQSKSLKAFAKLVSEWMVANDCANPASVPASVVEDFRTKAGL